MSVPAAAVWPAYLKRCMGYCLTQFHLYLRILISRTPLCQSSGFVAADVYRPCAEGFSCAALDWTSRRWTGRRNERLSLFVSLRCTWFASKPGRSDMLINQPVLVWRWAVVALFLYSLYAWRVSEVDSAVFFRVFLWWCVLTHAGCLYGASWQIRFLSFSECFLPIKTISLSSLPAGLFLSRMWLIRESEVFTLIGRNRF